jgi:hypothetical protein
MEASLDTIVQKTKILPNTRTHNLFGKNKTKTPFPRCPIGQGQARYTELL